MIFCRGFRCGLVWEAQLESGKVWLRRLSPEDLDKILRVPRSMSGLSLLYVILLALASQGLGVEEHEKKVLRSSLTALGQGAYPSVFEAWARVIFRYNCGEAG